MTITKEFKKGTVASKNIVDEFEYYFKKDCKNLYDVYDVVSKNKIIAYNECLRFYHNEIDRLNPRFYYMVLGGHNTQTFTVLIQFIMDNGEYIYYKITKDNLYKTTL